MTDPWDIALHTIPTFLVCIGMGFMLAFGLHNPGDPFSMFLMAGALVGGTAFCTMWHRREVSQHGGRLGGTQSWLEAYVPAIVGALTLVVSTAAFYFFPI